MELLTLKRGNMAVNLLESKHKQFLKLCCKDLRLTDIPHKMGVSVSTVEKYQKYLFQKLKVKTRIGLVRFAIKNQIVDLKSW